MTGLAFRRTRLASAVRESTTTFGARATTIGGIAIVIVALVPWRAGAQRGAATVTMRESVYEKLSEAQEAAGAGDHEAALAALREVEKMRNLEPYERAQLNTAFGYLYFTQEKYAESIGAYEKVLEEEAELPEVMASSTRYTLAQLEFQTGDYEAAIRYLERWLAAATNPGPEPLVLLGQAYYQLQRTREAVGPIERAIAVAGERGQPVKEEWYQLLRVFYHELEDYPELLRVLEFLVTEHPKKDYWLHLGGVYGEIRDARRQLAIYELAHVQGFLTGAAEIRLLSQLLLQADVPHRAGVVLARGLADGIVDGTAEDYLLLSQAWTLAREDTKAIEALIAAAPFTADGEVDARLAQSYANVGDWDRAVESARAALGKGVREPHELHVLMGMALFELDRHEEARGAFHMAQEIPAGRAIASRWLAYVESELARLRELERTLR